MDSVVRLMGSSSMVSAAERVVRAENQRLTAEEKKRRLLSFGPPGKLGGIGAIISTEPGISPSEEDAQLLVIGDPIHKIIHWNSESSTVGVSAKFGFLEQTSNLFLRHAGLTFVEKFYDLANKYEILNSDGVCIIYAGETLEKFGVGSRWNKYIQFDVSVLLPDGRPILNIVSQKGVTTISDFKKVLGTTIDIPSILSPHELYSVRDWNMCEIFKLKKATNGSPGEFDILSKEFGKVGQFTNNWNSSLSNYVAIDKLYGISFPVDMCTEEKTILIGALFTLYFQHLQDKPGRAKQRKFWLFWFCICLGIVLVITIFSLALWGILKED